MSEQNIEVVRGIYQRWGEGNFGDDAGHLDRGVVFALSPGFPDAGTYSGIEEVAAYTRDLLEPWELFTIEAEEIVPVGDRVLASVRQCGTGSGSGVPVEFRYFMLWTLRDGKVIRFENFRERAQALEAAESGD